MILPQTFCTLRDDQQTLAFYNISEGSIIHLVGMGTVGAGNWRNFRFIQYAG